MRRPIERKRIVFPPQFRVEALRDEVIEATGHPPASSYARTYYLPVLGPSCLILAEHLISGLVDAPAGYEVDLAILGTSVGLPGSGRSSSICRTLGRLCRFGLARWHEDQARYRMRMVWPPLSRRLLARLPPGLLELHPAA